MKNILKCLCGLKICACERLYYLFLKCINMNNCINQTQNKVFC